MTTTTNYGLSEAQLQQYEQDGFLVLRDWFDQAAVQKLSQAADELLDKVGPVVSGNPRIQVDRIDETARVRQVYPVIDISDTFAALSRDARVLDPFRSLFNDTPVLFEDKLNYKYPSGGSPFPMHQDYSYWQDYSPQLTTALIYIDQATEENGCLEVVPGWHNKGLLPIEKIQVGQNVDHYVSTKVLDPSLAVKAPGSAGTMLLFSCFTPHSSGPNLSSHRRRAIILTYNPARDGSGYEATSGAHLKQIQTWLNQQ
jgi:ectoine hydroxylase-related dioxygenase (phytanoyl-CoA dioxygenase family)